MKKTALGIFAHPDDAEMMCAGTLSLLKKREWSIAIATMTPGDKGSAEHSREVLSLIRKQEAENAAGLIKASYHCLGFEDLYISYGREAILKTTDLIRKVRPSVVFTSSPQDYMIDHEITSTIVQTACFSCGVKNMEIDSETFEPVPYLYYSDPMEGKNKFGEAIPPSIFIDISSEIEVKKNMLKCHESQRSWLLSHHKIDEYILSMENFSKKRGRECNSLYAEGFRQHLGHGYPQDNILLTVLGDNIVKTK